MKPIDLIKPIVGKMYKFPDGDRIEVIQVKSRSEEDLLITVHITQGPGIPRKLVFPYKEFLDTYGHLFGISTDNGGQSELNI